MAEVLTILSWCFYLKVAEKYLMMAAEMKTVKTNVKAKRSHFLTLNLLKWYVKVTVK